MLNLDRWQHEVDAECALNDCVTKGIGGVSVPPIEYTDGSTVVCEYRTPQVVLYVTSGRDFMMFRRRGPESTIRDELKDLSEPRPLAERLAAFGVYYEDVLRVVDEHHDGVVSVWVCRANSGGAYARKEDGEIMTFRSVADAERWIEHADGVRFFICEVTNE